MKRFSFFCIAIFFGHITMHSQLATINEGPFNQLIIRGVTLINGDGAPPIGPVDIVVENNKIVAIENENQIQEYFIINKESKAPNLSYEIKAYNLRDFDGDSFD